MNRLAEAIARLEAAGVIYAWEGLFPGKAPRAPMAPEQPRSPSMCIETGHYYRVTDIEYPSGKVEQKAVKVR